jgi:hypothetical protein
MRGQVFSTKMNGLTWGCALPLPKLEHALSPRCARAHAQPPCPSPTLLAGQRTMHHLNSWGSIRMSSAASSSTAKTSLEHLVLSSAL